VLGLAVSDLLMEQFPHAGEGELSRRRAALVNARALAARGGALGLGAVVRLGKGEEKSGGRRKASILAGAYEAVLGAVYLDGGYGAARKVVARQFAADVAGAEDESPIDHKSRLQEITQRLFRETPQYSLVEASGPEHDRAFVTELRIRGELRGRGTGKTKKEAEQEAAREALRRMEPDAKPAR
jgi:ribonuclease III